MLTEKYQPSVTAAQARGGQDACECYMRLLMGQLHMVADFAWKEMGDRHQDQRALSDSMRALGPLISQRGLNGSKGIFNPTLHNDAKVCHDVNSVIRHRLSWDEHPEGNSMSVWFDEPMKAGTDPLPTIEGVESC